MPATLAVLDDIGVLPAVEAAGFVRKWGATMSWGRSSEPWSWYFKETNRRFPHSYQVWRPTFDAILLDHAADCGVAVHCGVAVAAVEAGGVTLAGGVREQAAMVVDASGQRALVASSRGLQEWDSAFRNLAVYGYFDGGRHLEAPDDGNIFIEATAHGWLWKIPLAGGVSSVGAVVDRDYGAGEIRRLGLDRFFSGQIASGARTRDLLDGAVARQGPNAVRDWSYCARSMVGDGFVLVGDAACFIDPLFSTGVHLAVSGAHLAAAYVTTALSTPHLRAAAGGSYERLYTNQYAHFRELAKLFYASNRTSDSYFWEARRIAGTPDDSPRAAFVRAVSGQTAAGYERSVLRHGVLPEHVPARAGGRNRRPARPAHATFGDDPGQAGLWSDCPGPTWSSATADSRWATSSTAPAATSCRSAPSSRASRTTRRAIRLPRSPNGSPAPTMPTPSAWRRPCLRRQNCSSPTASSPKPETHGIPVPHSVSEFHAHPTQNAYTRSRHIATETGARLWREQDPGTHETCGKAGTQAWKGLDTRNW